MVKDKAPWQNQKEDQDLHSRSNSTPRNQCQRGEPLGGVWPASRVCRTFVSTTCAITRSH